MRGERLGPGQVAGGQLEQGHRIGLDDIRRGATGVPAAFADAELDGGHRGHPDLDAATGIAGAEQSTGGPRGCSQGGWAEVSRGGGQLCTNLLQLLHVGW